MHYGRVFTKSSYCTDYFGNRENIKNGAIFVFS